MEPDAKTVTTPYPLEDRQAIFRAIVAIRMKRDEADWLLSRLIAFLSEKTAEPFHPN